MALLTTIALTLSAVALVFATYALLLTHYVEARYRRLVKQLEALERAVNLGEYRVNETPRNDTKHP